MNQHLFRSSLRSSQLLAQVGLGEGKFDSEPAFFSTYLNESVIKEHWLGWQKTTRRQFEIDRAMEEKKRIDLLAAKKDKGGKAEKKKKGAGEGGAKEAGGEEDEPPPPEPLPEGGFTLQIGEEEVVYVQRDWSKSGPSSAYRGYYCGMLSVETAVTSKYLSAAQTASIISHFPADEDGIRVEVCLVLFGRVVDLENFPSSVVDALTVPEQRELAWR